METTPEFPEHPGNTSLTTPLDGLLMAMALITTLYDDAKLGIIEVF